MARYVQLQNPEALIDKTIVVFYHRSSFDHPRKQLYVLDSKKSRGLLAAAIHWKSMPGTHQNHLMAALSTGYQLSQ